MLRSTAQTANDGVVSIYSVTNTAADGDMPAETITLKQTLRYKERTVGFKRYFAAKEANVKVEYVLRCPRVSGVTSQDVAVPNDGKQYRIVQVQYPEDVYPPVMDLTLEKIDPEYSVAEVAEDAG